MRVGGVDGVSVQELVIAGDGGQRAFVRWEAGDHGGGVREAALGKTDNAVLDDVFFRSGIAIVPDPPRGVPFGGDPPCFHGDDVRADRPDLQGGRDPADHVCVVHGPVQEQDVDEFAGGGGVSVGLAGSGT